MSTDIAESMYQGHKNCYQIHTIQNTVELYQFLPLVYLFRYTIQKTSFSVNHFT